MSKSSWQTNRLIVWSINVNSRLHHRFFWLFHSCAMGKLPRFARPNVNLVRTLTACLSGRTNHLRKLVFIDRQTDGQTQTTKLSENLFVPFSHQTICNKLFVLLEPHSSFRSHYWLWQPFWNSCININHNPLPLPSLWMQSIRAWKANVVFQRKT